LQGDAQGRPDVRPPSRPLPSPLSIARPVKASHCWLKYIHWSAGIGNPNHDRSGIGHSPESFFTLTQSFLCLPAIRNIADHRKHTIFTADTDRFRLTSTQNKRPFLSRATQKANSPFLILLSLKTVVGHKVNPYTERRWDTSFLVACDGRGSLSTSGVCTLPQPYLW